MLARSILLVTFLCAACGTDSRDLGGGDDDTGGGSDDMGSGSGSEMPPPEPADLTIVSKDVTLMPGEETTYCYYFHTPNTDTLAIRKWYSTMTPGSHHMIMYFGNDQQPADGTVSASGCGGVGTAAGVPYWVYAAQTPQASLELPTDDGTGKPLGMNLPPHQPAYFQMHYLNATDQPMTAHVTLYGYAHAATTQYTQTAAFVTYNSVISIAPHATNDVESQTCIVPANAKFWTVSTHAHKQATLTKLKDGQTTVFSSSDWEHPGEKDWMAMPFYTFSSGTLTYECTYTNNGDNANSTVVSGPSAQTNEMCMGIGYFFPATAPRFCLNSTGPL